MAKREIRTHYSGVIIFTAKLASLATGIAFALVVANYLSGPEQGNEYGIWGLFFSILIPYFTIVSGAISFWSMRFVARGMEGATKTGIVANGALATIAALVYLALLPVIAPTFGLQNYVVVYLIMAIHVVELYLLSVLESCLQGNKPEYVGYGLLVGEVLKVLFVYLFVVYNQFGIVGVATSVVVAFSVKITFYIAAVFDELKQKVKFSYIREWIRGSAFSIYNVIGDRIAAVLFLMLAIYGTETAVGYYTATAQIANIIVYSTFLAFALPSKLLADGKIDEATLSLKLVLMFAIPMTAGVLSLPSSYLVFLKTSGEYVVAAPVLIILAIDALVLATSSIFNAVLFGIERVDEKAKIPFREVTRSRVFISFSLPYAHSAITLPIAFYALTTFAHNDPLQVAIYVTGINTIGHVAMFFVLYYVVRSAVKLNIPWKSIAKYTISSAAMAAVLFTAHPASRAPTLIFTAIGGLVYIGVLLAIDKETRTLLRTSLTILKSKTQALRPRTNQKLNPSS